MCEEELNAAQLNGDLQRVQDLMRYAYANFRKGLAEVDISNVRIRNVGLVIALDYVSEDGSDCSSVTHCFDTTNPLLQLGLVRAVCTRMEAEWVNAY